MAVGAWNGDSYGSFSWRPLEAQQRNFHVLHKFKTVINGAVNDVLQLMSFPFRVELHSGLSHLVLSFAFNIEPPS